MNRENLSTHVSAVLLHSPFPQPSRVFPSFWVHACRCRYCRATAALAVRQRRGTRRPRARDFGRQVARSTHPGHQRRLSRRHAIRTRPGGGGGGGSGDPRPTRPQRSRSAAGGVGGVGGKGGKAAGGNRDCGGEAQVFPAGNAAHGELLQQVRWSTEIIVVADRRLLKKIIVSSRSVSGMRDRSAGCYEQCDPRVS